MRFFRFLRSRSPSQHDWLMLGIGAAISLACIGIISTIQNMQTPLAYQPAGITTPWVPSTVRRWEGPIEAMAKKYNLDANVVAIIMTLESAGYSKAHSQADAQGLMQVTKPTAGDIAARYLKEPRRNYDIWDPHTNIEFGVAYLAMLRDEFGTSSQGPSWNSTVELIAAGYNGGPGAANSLEQGKGLRGIETLTYSRDAFNMWRERNAPVSPTFERWVERGGSTLIDLAKGEKN